MKNKKGTKVIVGVIDTGVDINHEDLKSVIWTNKKEIPNNGIDDDKNGFIDDIHGWNFLGNAVNENLEMTRIVKKGDDGSPIYKEAKAELDKKIEDYKGKKQQVDFIFNCHKSISDYLKKENYTIDEVNEGAMFALNAMFPINLHFAGTPAIATNGGRANAASLIRGTTPTDAIEID